MSDAIWRISMPALRRVRMLVLDVDGVLTDGRLFYGARGESLKAFHVRDGHGIKQVAAAGITVAIISGRKSAAVARRARELGIRHVTQGAGDKLAALRKLAKARARGARSIAPASVTTHPMRRCCRRRDSRIAVADAHADALAAADLVTTRRGGHGAVREVCDWLLRRAGACAHETLVASAGLAWRRSSWCAGAYFIGRAGRSDDDAETAAAKAPDPGYAARDAKIIETGYDGRERYRLNARVIRQQIESGIIDLEHLEMDYHPGAQGKCRARRRLSATQHAKSGTSRPTTGEVRADGDDVQLTGNVDVTGPAPAAASR